jgi:hypothetical protein
MEAAKNYPKFNIIVTPDGLERVSILSRAESTLEALEFYKNIIRDVGRLDKKIRGLGKTKHNGLTIPSLKQPLIG